ncbi:MAG: hypothetical protein COC19_03035 [SAR86 cluster bacterium]|uniref:Uncharacterized protein n=1 Tax=SAR86 cluster bacterium TaxID=2030880 RepID=A0A2A4MR41_9GAMM|nr:MAG: hypothetical protein COC19_03035 [SAR86 cluster bacterium]
MKVLISSVFSCLILLPTGFLAAQETAAEQLEAQQVPYEIKVTPTFLRSDIAALIKEVEEGFIERFNELNLDDDYDVKCFRFTPTMSHISQRSCEPKFLIEGRAADASDAGFRYSHVRNLADLESISTLSGLSLRRSMHREYEIFQSKLKALISSDANLKTIAVQLDVLHSRLNNFEQEN